jgi:hypothetical protein
MYSSIVLLGGIIRLMFPASFVVINSNLISFASFIGFSLAYHSQTPNVNAPHRRKLIAQNILWQARVNPTFG